RSGLRVMAGFIIGFDGEKSGAGERIVQFVKQTTIPTAFFSMLQALPDTGLWHRLEKEGRLRKGEANINQTSLMNFVPTRPIEEITREYIKGFWELYDPQNFLDRTYQHYRILGTAPCYQKRKQKAKPAKFEKKLAGKPIDLQSLRALGILLWRQGIKRKTRFTFWWYLLQMLLHHREVILSYLTVCAHGEHFIEYRGLVKQNIEQQLAQYLAEEAAKEETTPPDPIEAIAG
ncbi:MAG: DUF4070 domain-containing protein, partial [Kamptonema sp. SIO4C4]|nr:DUF4070 domain-containing protein [Kamptonema sp. SIO4C4]